ncbi:helix-turn-helix domain-containing protein [Agromyces humi]|uniref:helix-turn-helix domain-containing protein n=1 Tax=Agromyces humi TaxID=1766800 RepID=UPI00135B9131|nr:helix-turn-helix transcriptional regulator [Agromyces humi]
MTADSETLERALRVSEQSISSHLVTISEEIIRATGESGHFLSAGYGAEFTNGVFEMHSYSMDDCDCGHEFRAWEWESAHPHAEHCFQQAIIEKFGDDAWEVDADRLAKFAAEHGITGPGILSACTCSHAPLSAAWYATNDHDPACVIVRPNFRHFKSGVEVRWYKRVGRGMKVTGPTLNAAEWLDLVLECVRSITPAASPSMSDVEQLAELLVEGDGTFHRELIRARIHAGLSAGTVAERMGVSKEDVAAFERYDADPTLSLIRRYALAVGVHVEHLVHPRA